MWRVPSKRLAQQPEVGSKRARAVPPANIAVGREETARQVLFACQRHLLKSRQESVGGSSHPCSETTRGTQLPMGGVSMRLAPNVLPAVFFYIKKRTCSVLCAICCYICVRVGFLVVFKLSSTAQVSVQFSVFVPVI